ncbi:hypothetical protein Landi51_01686 [Colletotrichum acutatum]
MQAYQDDRLDRAEQIAGYGFSARSLLREALQTPGPGVLTAGDRSIIDGNKTLALLGDRVLGTLLVEAMVIENLEARGEFIFDNEISAVSFPFKRLTWTMLGAIDAQLQRAVNNVRLAEIFDTFDFLECLNLNPSQGRAIGARTKADTIEAIIGAAYLDGGLDAARLVATRLGIL